MATNGFDKRPQDINRKGRPKKPNAFKDILEKYMKGFSNDPDNPGKRKRNNTLFIQELATIAFDRKHPKQFDALKYLIDRYAGKPTEQVKLSQDEEAPGYVVVLPATKSVEEWMKNYGGSGDQTDGSVEPPAEAGDSAQLPS